MYVLIHCTRSKVTSAECAHHEADTSWQTHVYCRTSSPTRSVLAHKSTCWSLIVHVHAGNSSSAIKRYIMVRNRRASPDPASVDSALILYRMDKVRSRSRDRSESTAAARTAHTVRKERSRSSEYATSYRSKHSRESSTHSTERDNDPSLRALVDDNVSAPSDTSRLNSDMRRDLSNSSRRESLVRRSAGRTDPYVETSRESASEAARSAKDVASSSSDRNDYNSRRRNSRRKYELRATLANYDDSLDKMRRNVLRRSTIASQPTASARASDVEGSREVAIKAARGLRSERSLATYERSHSARSSRLGESSSARSLLSHYRDRKTPSIETCTDAQYSHRMRSRSSGRRTNSTLSSLQESRRVEERMRRSSLVYHRVLSATHSRKALARSHRPVEKSVEKRSRRRLHRKLSSKRSKLVSRDLRNSRRKVSHATSPSSE